MKNTKRSQGVGGRIVDLTEKPGGRPALASAERSPESPSVAVDRTALLAHEIRASLTAIKGFGITLREHCDDLRPPERRFAIEAIIRGSDAVLRIADDLLASGRAEAGFLRMKSERVDMLAVAQHVVDVARRLHPRFEFSISADGPLWVMGDSAMLGRALDNLIRNAVQHAPHGSRIDVEAVYVLDGFAMGVRNDGPPPPEEVRRHLFERYATVTQGGNGLGLYLTRLIVEAHGGRVWFSHGKDGNRFAFILPAGGRSKASKLARTER